MTIHKTPNPNPNRWSLNAPHPMLFNANHYSACGRTLRDHVAQRRYKNFIKVPIIFLMIMKKIFFYSFCALSLWSQDLNSINTADQDYTNSSKHRSVVLPSDSPQHGSGSRSVQRNSLQRMRRISNRKYDSGKEPKASGLTLLDILCGDFEHGVILLEKNNKESDSSSGNISNELSHRRDKQSKEGHKERRREKPFPSDIYKSFKSASKKESKETRLAVAQSEVGDTGSSSSRSKSISFEALNSDDTLNTSSISTWGLNSQESVPLRDVPAQKLNWTSDNSVNSFGLGEAEKSLQSPERQSHEWNSPKQTHGKIELLTAENPEHWESSDKVEESTSFNQTCLTSNSEGQVWKHQRRFVHLKENRKLTRKKKLGVTMNNEKDKLSRTKSPEVKLFQLDVPHTSQGRKSQVNKQFEFLILYGQESL